MKAEPSLVNVFEGIFNSFNAIVNKLTSQLTGKLDSAQHLLEAKSTRRGLLDLDEPAHNSTTREYLRNRRNANASLYEKLKKTSHEIVRLKQNLATELNETLVEYDSELRKLTGELGDRSKQLATRFKTRFNQITADFVKSLKDEDKRI